MDLALIERWNSVVGPYDYVWHLGDFTFYKDQETIDTILSSLNGIKNLIVGNHDHIGSKHWSSMQSYKELFVGNQMFVLSHYPMVDWNGRFKGAIHLYGHTHDRYHPEFGDSAMDVGVDSHDYYPLTIEQVKEKLKHGWQGPKFGWDDPDDVRRKPALLENQGPKE